MRNLRCRASTVADHTVVCKAAGYRGCAIFIGEEESALTRDIGAQSQLANPQAGCPVSRSWPPVLPNLAQYGRVSLNLVQQVAARVRRLTELGPCGLDISVSVALSACRLTGHWKPRARERWPGEQIIRRASANG